MVSKRSGGAFGLRTAGPRLSPQQQSGKTNQNNNNKAKYGHMFLELVDPRATGRLVCID